MTEAVVIAPDTPLGAQMARAAETRRLIFFAGLPGVGKSLFLQQQALLAARAGRRVHLLQWDVARAPFESAAMLAKYPEIDGFTHPLIRMAVGDWARRALWQWHTDFAAPENLLIGEAPLVGNRFVELVQRRDDRAEALLAGEDAVFFVPVPSKAVRERIESKRAASIANPRHANESRDAPPNVLQQIWRDARAAATDLGLAGGAEDEASGMAAGADYDPALYARLYEHLLQHRHHRLLDIDTLYPGHGSVYDLAVPAGELAAAPADAAAIAASLENDHGPAAIIRSVEDWYRV